MVRLKIFLLLVFFSSYVFAEDCDWQGEFWNGGGSDFLIAVFLLFASVWGIKAIKKTLDI